MVEKFSKADEGQDRVDERDPGVDQRVSGVVKIGTSTNSFEVSSPLKLLRMPQMLAKILLVPLRECMLPRQNQKILRIALLRRRGEVEASGDHRSPSITMTLLCANWCV